MWETNDPNAKRILFPWQGAWADGGKEGIELDKGTIVVGCDDGVMYIDRNNLKEFFDLTDKPSDDIQKLTSRVGAAISCLKSCIKSGEEWTSTLTLVELEARFALDNLSLFIEDEVQRRLQQENNRSVCRTVRFKANEEVEVSFEAY